MDTSSTEKTSGKNSSSDRGARDKLVYESVLKFICHSRTAIEIGREFGWKPGARYTNLRDTRHRSVPEFLDIDWKNYDFDRHLEAAQICRPILTIARDVEDADDLTDIIDEAFLLLEHCRNVAIVPKDVFMAKSMERQVPKNFIFAYSVPTRYGGTEIPAQFFRRPVHLLGGRPDVQKALSKLMTVVSLDCNRFTYDARFGDYFDGETFRPHPVGGYETCLRASFKKIDELWKDHVVTAKLL